MAVGGWESTEGLSENIQTYNNCDVEVCVNISNIVHIDPILGQLIKWLCYVRCLDSIKYLYTLTHTTLVTGLHAAGYTLKTTNNDWLNNKK